jgi:hypothetical protein
VEVITPKTEFAPLVAGNALTPPAPTVTVIAEPEATLIAP